MITVKKYDTEQALASCDNGLSRKQRRELFKTRQAQYRVIQALGIEASERQSYKSMTDKHNRTYTGEGMRTGRVSELILAGNVINEYTKPILPLERALARNRALLKYKT